MKRPTALRPTGCATAEFVGRKFVLCELLGRLAECDFRIGNTPSPLSRRVGRITLPVPFLAGASPLRVSSRVPIFTVKIPAVCTSLDCSGPCSKPGCERGSTELLSRAAVLEGPASALLVRSRRSPPVASPSRDVG